AYVSTLAQGPNGHIYLGLHQVTAPLELKIRPAHSSTAVKQIYPAVPLLAQAEQMLVLSALLGTQLLHLDGGRVGGRLGLKESGLTHFYPRTISLYAISHLSSLAQTLGLWRRPIVSLPFGGAGGLGFVLVFIRLYFRTSWVARAATSP